LDEEDGDEEAMPSLELTQKADLEYQEQQRELVRRRMMAAVQDKRTLDVLLEQLEAYRF
jgi:hypothetical protein